MAAVLARDTAWHHGARYALEYAIAASLALHVLALLSFPSLPSLSMQPLPPAPPLEARLMPAQPPETPKPAPVPEVEPKAVEPKPAPPALRRPAPRPKPRPPARPVAERPQLVAEPVVEPAPAPAAAPAPVVAPPPRAQSPIPAAAPPAPAAPRSASRPDAASLVARYRSAIMLEAARYKRYPRFARDNGWEGRVEVRLAIGADGAIRSISAARGSGYAILDRQALEMVRNAKPATTIPEGLRGKPFSVDIPVIFSLRDAEG